MSYILEALKKAQAERQLGATPTIHAPTLESGVSRSPSPVRWRPLALALAAAAAVAAGALTLLWRQPGTPETSPSVAVQAAPVQATAAGPATPVVPAPSVTPVAVQLARVAAAPPAQMLTPPVAPPAGTVAAVEAAPVSATATQAATGAATKPAAVPAAKPAPVAAEPQEEPAQWLRELPEPIQRAIPPIAMGGYMYSKNPADRLVLIDKVLRREGEEVAPGLVLERLLPKAAVFTFKGYRYRVAY